ncbi:MULTISPECIES: glycine--tRNA ligase subunit beta [unclassified Novosphingobium]|uniref:glycine--tRNA ligase subunit beta n=1 Tax=unclassified Novosphingobium TaxID=2644732 RepID=UPI0014948E81|nr:MULTISPECIES: glycine--tRNA ligase subunit beta [unclassified Novosphingobium]MBB3358455.1 glycyl-tRNA synthetase beta chain [Novosphingobium sp. BK256]MBB3374816.1 glycyl-tRNA synthetase beta chain [Novosphingobium sp. BK280]MBB3379495.1 glycyl-tRNA synthetase beta chain [Novosphingobium sp. BK258]MBB3421190.1 glycyl-tRNA synthetase beta chain [Novosphingobium sp. BK267]MBB3449237.1 glycyl-tRNA synthetase beta chain [Novosphingobium sp. BK352]
MTADFLLELRSEEIPARMQAGARADLEKLFVKELTAAGLTPGAITVWSTPRRLALIARDLPLGTQAVSEEVKGPRASAPPQALEGFLRKTGLTREQLTERDGVLFAITEKPGRATKDVLAQAIPAIVRAFPWPKSQRWGAASFSPESLRWVRPLSGIIAILGDEAIDLEVGGIRSGTVTRGHRFHHSGDITITGAADYAARLRDAYVIVDHAEREALVRDGARAAAQAAGLVLVDDEGLVVENAGLTEWPQPLLGRFDEAFLDVPPEVIQLTARVNQKYFICRDAAGKLANAFVCTANIAATDGGAAIVAGNRKVLAARLSDARFFWEQDKKVPLARQAKKLARITFHEKLGSVADKVARVADLAEWLAREGVVPGADPALARQAAQLCKADLVTDMVGEFPELQGLMGGYYARAEGLGDAVADAIRDHYKPVGQGDDVPTAPVSVCVALADKLDTLVGFFAVNEKPTGSKDPFALRRAALAIIRLLLKNNCRVDLSDPLVITAARNFSRISIIERQHRIDARVNLELVLNEGISEKKIDEIFDIEFDEEKFSEEADNIFDYKAKKILDDLMVFFAERLKVQQREAGVRHDLIDAVFALGGENDVVRLLARVSALQAFVGTEDGVNLLAGYKRAANILKKEAAATAGAQGEGVVPPTGEEDPLVLVDDPLFKDVAAEFAHGEAALSYTPEPAEAALMAALAQAEPQVDEAVAQEAFTTAMAALASLRAPIDAFFDDVTVNDADAEKRAHRLALLDQFRAAVHKVADFSRIEG